MANVTKINDLMLRERKVKEASANGDPRRVIAFSRKTPESKASVNDMAQEATRFLDHHGREAQRKADEDALIREISGPLDTSISAAYRSLTPERALLLVEQLHSVVRLRNGVK